MQTRGGGGQKIRFCRRHMYMAPCLKIDVGRPLVEPDSDAVELGLEKFPVHVLLGRVENHEDEVGGAGDCDDLTSAALALSGTLDDSRQVEQLQEVNEVSFNGEV